MSDANSKSNGDLPTLFREAVKKLEIVCLELDLWSDEPLEKLRAQIKDRVRRERNLAEAADVLVTAAHPQPGGYFIIPGHLNILSRAVDEHRGQFAPKPKQEANPR